jgi:hypothetical protein
MFYHLHTQVEKNQLYNNFDSVICALLEQIIKHNNKDSVFNYNKCYIEEFKQVENQNYYISNQKFVVKFVNNSWEIVNQTNIPINPFWMSDKYHKLMATLNKLQNYNVKINKKKNYCRKCDVIPVLPPEQTPLIQTEIPESFISKQKEFEKAKQNRNIKQEKVKLKNDPEVDRLNDENRKRRFEEQRLEERKRIFVIDKKNYLIFKKELESGELSWDDFPILFAQKFLILRLLDDRCEINFDNDDSIDKEFAFYDEIIKQLEHKDENTRIAIPYNYNYMTSEQKEEYSKKMNISVEDLERLAKCEFKESECISDFEIDFGSDDDILGLETPGIKIPNDLRSKLLDIESVIEI